MARGGYRPGAGRPKGSTVKAKKSKTVFHGDIITNAKANNLTPLEYMLDVMSDPNEPNERRDRMAIAAAPYCHPRKVEGSSKETKAARALAASEGRFAPSKPPMLKVVE